MSFSYANPTSGPSAGGIGWMNFGNITLNPGDSASFSGVLNNGVQVSFDLSLNLVSGTPRSFSGTPVPTYPLAQFGTAGYTGLVGNVAMYSQNISLVSSVSTFLISNVVVKDINNIAVPNYTILIGDAEDTNLFESIKGQTNGDVWNLFTTVGTGGTPTLTGVGTSTFDIVGNQQFGAMKAYVLSSQNATNVTLTISNQDPTISRQGFVIGFATTQVTLQKNIGNRIDASDQFILDINGNPGSTVTTSGNANGIQSQRASIFATAGNTYIINESMALGSASALSDYTQIISASNATPSGSIPPVGTLPINVTPILGDDITYTIVNAAPEIFTKKVDKAFADIGDIITYEVTIENPNNFEITNVQFNDATPSGTVYIGNLTVSVPYTGIDPATGLVITIIAANSSVVIAWQVQVNTFPPIPNPVANYANIIVPQGTSGMSNVVTTQVNTAFVSIIKMVDKAYATVDDVLTYSFLLHNSGNVPANNVIITDILPLGTSFIPGTLVGASGTLPTLTLLGSIPSMKDAMVQFQVKVDGSIPSPNPILNEASIQYSYTVDPQNPNGSTKTNNSNQVSTLVNEANVQIDKQVDKTYAGVNDVLTYTFLLKNTGNVAANNVVINDVLVNGITFVPGSLIGAIGTPNAMTLNSPLAAGDSTTVSFQVQVNGSIPSPNPILDKATVNYTFTVDPNNPDAVTKSQESNEVQTLIQEAKLNIQKAVDKAFADVNDVITYTLTLQNIGNTAANNIVIQDVLPAGTTFINGALIGAIGTPPTLSLPTSIAPNTTHTISFQVLTSTTLPNPNPLVNDATATYTYTINPNNPDGANGNDMSNIVTTQINTAHVTTLKTVDKEYANVGDIITYTLALYNSGNTLANNVVIHDVLPHGVSFVEGSLSGATGTPPNFKLSSSIGAQSFAYVSFSVRIDELPSTDKITNQADVSYTYTVNPLYPNDHQSNIPSNTVTTQVRQAIVSIEKSVNKTISYIGDIITYKIAVKNSGNVSANNIVIQDVLANGIQYVNNSVQSNVTIIFNLPTITLTQPLLPGQIAVIEFQARVISMPNPNPIANYAILNYTYVLDPNEPPVSIQRTSNTVFTEVFRNAYPQQITDIIESVALEQAALAQLMQAEGAKIQTAVSQGSISQEELLCINKSVADVISSIQLLEIILKQKMSVLDCQILGSCAN